MLFSGGDRPRRLLPPDAPAALESFGRCEGPAPGGDALVGLELGRTVKDALTVDPDRVLDEMVEACDSVGGWSYYGAWDILSTFASDHADDPRYVRIVDGLLDKMAEEGYGPGDIPGVLTPRAIERQRAEQVANQEAEGAPEPEPEPEIPPLAQGERRLLQVIDRPDGNQNRIWLIHGRPCDDPEHKFVAVIQSSEATDFDFDTEWAWHRGADERTVYIRVGEAYANARTATCRYWLDPNVKWFAERAR